MLESRRLPVVAALVAALLTSPSLFAGFATEDWVQRGSIRRGGFPILKELNVFGHGGLWTAADVVKRNREYQRAGWFPWITDPHFDVSFFRPLASLTHHFDYHRFPDHPWVMHLENIAMYAALAAAVAALHARLLAPRWLAGFSALMYAADDAHGHPVGWIMNRNALMATLFSVLSLIAYDRFRRDGSKLGAALTALCWTLALGSAEFATCTIGYFVAHFFFVDRARLGRRLLGACTWLVPLAAWVIVYRRLGYTTHGSGLYIQPLSAPIEYVFETFERGSVLLMGQLAAPFADTWTHAAPYTQGFIVFWAVIVLWLLVRLAWPVIRTDPMARFWAAGLLLSLPPACATFPEDRLLLLAGVGAFPLIAQLLASVFTKAAEDSAAEVPGALPVGLAAALLTVHALIGPALLPVRALHMYRYDARVQAAGRSAYDHAKGHTKDALFLVNGEDFYFTGMMSISRVARGEPATWRMLTLAGTLEPLSLRRLDERRVEVRPRDGFLSRVFDRLYFSRGGPYGRGSTLDLTGIEVTISEVNQWGEPVAAIFTFSLPLDSPVYHWVVWKHDRYERFVIPPIGESVRVEG